MILDARATAYFFSRHSKAEGCWIWTGSKNPKGYGVVQLPSGVRTGAHRVAYTIHIGPIPEGMWVLHHCDNPPCVNPTHLFLGDNAANVADKVAKGRSPRMVKENNPMWKNYARAARGENSAGARFTEEQVMEIRQSWASGESQSSIGRRYGIRQGTVYGIVRGLNWTHLPVIRRPKEKDTRPRLTDNEVNEIRSLSGAGHSQASLSKRFGVASSTIRKIVHSRGRFVAVQPDLFDEAEA